MKSIAVKIGAAIGVWLLKLLIGRLPDLVLARLFRGVERLVYAATGDEAAAGAAAEVADIFESGPPFTVTVRKMAAAADPELIAGIMSCLFAKSPYGAA